MGFEVHDIAWTPEKVTRFWNWYAGAPAKQDVYWSKQFGRRLVAFLSKRMPLEGKIIDYGCGPGFLLRYLRESAPAAELFAADSSPDSIAIVEKSFADDPSFRGAYVVDGLPSKLADEDFDTVFFLEAIEHLLPDAFDDQLRELHRITAPGGRIVVTTPNAEELANSTVLCPDCGAVFHTVQHLTTWSAHSLSSLLEEFGFSQVLCTATDFSESVLLRGRSFVARAVGHGKPPHLVYVGQKV